VQTVVTLLPDAVTLVMTNAETKTDHQCVNITAAVFVLFYVPFCVI